MNGSPVNLAGGEIVAANDNNEFRFYVYAWLYPDGRPFYVGKGCGRRDVRPKNTTIFNRMVEKIRREGGEPRVVRWHEGLREEDAHRLEVAYIKLFGRRDNGTGVLANLTDGGEGVSGWVPSAEACSKISESKRGKRRSDETRAKISASSRGRVHSDEARAKMSEAHLGKARGEGTRAKISAALRRRTMSDEHIEKLRAAQLLAPPKNGFKGVHAIRNRWRAGIRINGKNHYLGYFLTSEEAARAYDKAAVAAWGMGNCYLNLPNDIAKAS